MKFKILIKLILLIIISLNVSRIYAQSQEYLDDNVSTIQIETTIHNLITNGTLTIPLSPNSQEPIPGIQKSKQRISADFEAKQWISHLYLYRHNYANNKFPTEVHYCNFKKKLTVDYLKQKVTITPFRPISLDGTNILWAGRNHAGRSLTNIIQSASTSIQKIKDTKQRSLIVGAPFYAPPQFPEPLKLILNSKKQVVELIEKQRHFYFTWAETENGFDYVKRSLMHTSGKELRISLEILVDKISLNSPLIERLFDVEYPEHFQVIDTRSLLTPLGF